MFIGRGCLCLFATATVQTLNHHENRTFRILGVMRCLRETFSCDFHYENRFATLDAIAILQRRVFNSLTVEKCSIRGSKITQERVRWIHLEQAMITREKAIVGQAKDGFRISGRSGSCRVARKKRCGLCMDRQ